MNKDTKSFELKECFINKVYYEENNSYIVGLAVEEEVYAIELNSYDATLLTFVQWDCAQYSHIHIIHQILLKFQESAGFILEKIIIEAKHGDVFYCRLQWSKNNNKVYSVISIGDALILHSLSKKPMWITQFVVGQLEKYEEDGFMNNIEE